jgi:hypothetical protein
MQPTASRVELYIHVVYTPVLRCDITGFLIYRVAEPGAATTSHDSCSAHGHDKKYTLYSTAKSMHVVCLCLRSEEL